MTIPLQRPPQPTRSSRRWQLLLVWFAAVLLLGGLLLLAQLRRNPLDDPNLAYERPGFLDAHGRPFPAPVMVDGVPSPGSRAVVFFTRPERASRLSAALAARPSLRERARIAIVVSGPMPPGDLPAEAFVADYQAGVAGVPVVADPSGRLAAAYQVPVPRDGGPPVGYAVVDRAGRVRYRTLDPEMHEHLDEVETIVRATP